jgi:TetR/AcrR family transcriptional regulator, tetracycline repressor protein
VPNKPPPDAPRRARREGPATPLSREGIVTTALRLVDREGLQALSMRRLGAALGVDPMAVYYHLPNKEALLDAIVEAVMAEIDLTLDDPLETPETRILVAARAYRDAMLAHRNALPIVLARGPATEVALRPVELLLGVLRAAGLPPEQALAGMNAIAAAVRGAVGMAGSIAAKAHAPDLVETLPFPHLREAFLHAGDHFERDFEFGLRALARGLLAQAPPRPARR